MIFELHFNKRVSQVVLVVKNPPANAGDVRDMSSNLQVRNIPGGGHCNPLSVLAWRMERGT